MSLLTACGGGRRSHTTVVPWLRLRNFRLTASFCSIAVAVSVRPLERGILRSKEAVPAVRILICRDFCPTKQQQSFRHAQGEVDPSSSRKTARNVQPALACYFRRRGVKVDFQDQLGKGQSGVSKTTRCSATQSTAYNRTLPARLVVRRRKGAPQ